MNWNTGFVGLTPRNLRGSEGSINDQYCHKHPLDTGHRLGHEEGLKILMKRCHSRASLPVERRRWTWDIEWLQACNVINGTKESVAKQQLWMAKCDLMKPAKP